MGATVDEICYFLDLFLCIYIYKKLPLAFDIKPVLKCGCKVQLSSAFFCASLRKYHF